MKRLVKSVVLVCVASAAVLLMGLTAVVLILQIEDERGMEPENRELLRKRS